MPITYPILEDLIHNAALLLLIVYLYDLVSSRWRWDRLTLGSVSVSAAVGFALGLIGIGVMMTPLDIGNGIIYDTRSVLLGIAVLVRIELAVITVAVAADLALNRRAEALRTLAVTAAGAAVALTPWLLLPAIPVVVAVLAFNFLGDGLRDAADPYG